MRFQEKLKITKRIVSLVQDNSMKALKIYIKTSTGYYNGAGATISDKTYKSFSKNLKIKHLAELFIPICKI